MSANLPIDDGIHMNGFKPEITIPYKVKRYVLKQNEIELITAYDRDKVTSNENLSIDTKKSSFKNAIHTICPASKWLPKYSIRENLLGDLTSGLAVAFLHISEGMAFGMLAGVDPIVGLYMAFFPTLIHCIFGTSKHISMGTFAVISIATSKLTTRFSDSNYEMRNLTDNSTVYSLPHYHYSTVQISSAVTLICGFYQLLMCIFKLGFLPSHFPESLLNGFSTAAACHILVSQLKEILGLNLPQRQGAFKFFFIIQDVVKNFSNTNYSTFFVSITCILFLLFMNEVVKPIAAGKCKFPIPTELITVMLSIALSHSLNLGELNYNVKEVGKVFVGIPKPELPPFELLCLVAIDSIPISIVSYSIAMKISQIFARKEFYTVKLNHELFAIGLSNIFGSFFSCIPVACSSYRSTTQYESGGKTQISSIITALIILIVILWLGPFFEKLPRAALSGLIIVSLKGMFFQIKALPRFFREGYFETIEWFGTFIAGILFGIDFGIYTGLLISVIACYINGLQSKSKLLGQILNTDIYVPLKAHKNVIDLQKIKIFHYSGTVNFATCVKFKKNLFNTIGIDQNLIKRASLGQAQSEARGFNNGIKYLIIDLGSITNIDLSGYRTIIEIRSEIKLIDVRVYLANANDNVYDTIIHAVKLGYPSFELFSSVHDAVLFAQG